MAMLTKVFIFSLVFTQSLTICSSQQTNASMVKCIDIERKALSKFRKSLTDELGRLSSWIGQECCSWKGITCSNQTGHVLNLDLHNPTPFDYDKFFNSQDDDYVAYYSKSCLAGDLNPVLLNLKYLQSLDLSMNNFSGSEIPKFLGSFKNLKYLNLSVTRFSGNVPSQIGNLSRLEFLDMSDFWTNRLVSDSLHWVTSLFSLKHLDLSGVKLGLAKDWLDSLNALPFLTKLNLSNTLVATIPLLSRPHFTSLVSLDLQWNTINSDYLPKWLVNMSNLSELRLDGNGFRGPIPEDFQNLKSLTTLGLSRNFFNSSLPNSLFSLRNLTYLDLSQNRFQGTIPNTVVNLCKLRFLDLTQNGFTGRIPGFGVNGENGCLHDLDVFRASYNSLNGPIPASLGNLSSLREFDISNNFFNGSIPLSFGQLSKLEKLDVSNNSLSGPVTNSHFDKLSKLTELSLSFNNIDFNVSLDWVPPFQLETIKLTSCNLGPLFPSWLQTQHNVVEMRISRTSISDRLPDWFEKLYSRIHYLDISDNNISGLLPKFEEANNRPFRRLILSSNRFDGPLNPLPSDVLLWDVSNNFLSGEIPFQNSTNITLQVLVLSNNRLSGQFPSFLCGFKTLMILDLANNRFTGKLPACIGEIKNLAMLDLTNNTMHGEIQNSIANLPLLSLHLHNNNFHGQLPSLENTMFLNILDVSRNSFTGTIPPWIGENMQSLKFLSLHSNNFQGELPASLCLVPQIQLLNLARNNLTGTIPPCIGDFSAMITEHSSIEYLVLDIDYGGSIPGIINGIERRYTTTMPFLTAIDLSDNSLIGDVPENLTGLVGLRSLNLAGNRLTGRIPEKIGDMKELISLDFSRNRLSGQIPQGLSLLNFLTYLNLSYNDLSGRIPTGNQLRTLNPSAYAGNDGLCGAPLARRCPGDDEVETQDDENDGPKDVDEGDDDDDDDDGLLLPWFYAGIGHGFLFGFLIVYGILHFVKSWRYTVFKWVENVAA